MERYPVKFWLLLIHKGVIDAREVKADVRCVVIVVLDSQGGYQNFLCTYKAQGGQ